MGCGDLGSQDTHAAKSLPNLANRLGLVPIQWHEAGIHLALLRLLRGET